MSQTPPDRPPPQPRKAWKLALYAVGLAANLLAVFLQVKQIMAGGDFTHQGLFCTALTGIFAALLYLELGRPKA
jgi:hypothetical protein